MASLLPIVAQQQMPHFDSMYWIMLVSRILHILGAVVLVGGLFYIRFILFPLPRREGQGEGSAASVDQLFGGPRATWAKWIGIATALLLVTGFWNLIQTIKSNSLPMSYHMIATLKILAAIVVFLLAALLAGRTAVAEAIRKDWRRWLNICLALGLLTVVLGSVLRSFPHNPKVDAPNNPQLMAPLVPLH